MTQHKRKIPHWKRDEISAERFVLCGLAPGVRGSKSLKTFRYSHGKYNFSTCEFCNVISNVLAKEHTDESRNMLLKLKFLHLDQQNRERDVMEQRKVSLTISAFVHSRYFLDVSSKRQSLSVTQVEIQ